MKKKRKTEWVVASLRGIPQPFLVIDSLIELYRLGYFGPAHKTKWSPKNYRQFERARWFSKSDFNKYRKILEKALPRKKVNLLNYASEYDKRITAYRRFAKKYKNADFRSLNNKKLAAIFEKWFEHTKRIWCFAYDYIIINKFLPEKIISKVAKKIPDLQAQNQALAILFETDKPSDMRMDKLSLVKIAQFARKNNLSLSSSIIKKRLDVHLDKFAHLGHYYFRGKPHTFKDFAKRLKIYLKRPQEKFKNIVKDLKIQQNNKKLTVKMIKKLKFSKKETYYIKILKRWATLSNYVNETYGYAVCHLQGLWQEIGQRLKISYGQFHSLTGKEIIKGLLKGKLEARLKREASQRLREHAIILERGKKRVLINRDLELYKIQEKKKELKIRKINQLKGETACPGIAKGKVRIVHSVTEAKKVKKGHILVANSTNPAFVPAMEKAGAIVTDEGGLLSHAAIVSRELKVPCVVGTKIATKVLKDGDKVEVDATKGLIKKIN